MAYSKQTWDTTSYFNPTRMNHIEQGVYDASNDNVTVLATSTGSKTYAEHISALKSVWNGLTENQKTKCKIKRNSAIYHCMDNSSGLYDRVIINVQNIYVEHISISDTTFSTLAGTTYRDLSDTTSTATFTLFI